MKEVRDGSKRGKGGKVEGKKALGACSLILQEQLSGTGLWKCGSKRERESERKGVEMRKAKS